MVIFDQIGQKAGKNAFEKAENIGFAEFLVQI